jgi:predicted nucleic acid-binding protein
MKCGRIIPEARVFLDTSALFAAVLSATGGARAILKLGESRAIRVWVGPAVLREADEVFRRKAPDLLPLLAALLHQAQTQVGPTATAEQQARAAALVDYAPDAQIVAEALACQADCLVTHDQEHLLRNPRLESQLCKVGTPGDCLAWLRQRLTE